MEIFTLIKSEHWKRRNKYYQMCRIVWYNNYLAPKNNNWRFVLIQQLWYETHFGTKFFLYICISNVFFPLLIKILMIFTIKHLHLKTIILLADLWNLWYTNDNSCLVLTLFTAGSQISLWASADDAVIIRQTGTTVQAPFTADS